MCIKPGILEKLQKAGIPVTEDSKICSSCHIKVTLSGISTPQRTEKVRVMALVELLKEKLPEKA